LSRAAAVSSLLLGIALIVVLPTLVKAAGYVGVLAGASSTVAMAGAFMLWSRATLVARALIVLAAAVTVFGQIIQAVLGLPGARELGQPKLMGNGIVIGFAVAALLFLVVERLCRRPEQTPDHPYAL